MENTILITEILGPFEIQTCQTCSRYFSLSQISDLELSISLTVISHSLPNISIFEIDHCLNFYFANLLRSSVSLDWGLALPCLCLLTCISALRWETWPKFLRQLVNLTVCIQIIGSFWILHLCEEHSESVVYSSVVCNHDYQFIGFLLPDGTSTQKQLSYLALGLLQGGFLVS